MISNSIDQSERVNKDSHVVIRKLVCVRNEYQNLKVGWIYMHVAHNKYTYIYLVNNL